MATTTWQEQAKAKRDATNSLIPQEWRLQNIASIEEQRDLTGTFLHQYLTAREVEITETAAEGILEQTTTGQWTAEEVTRAFSHRAALAHQHVNCLLEIFFEDAIADAKRLDAYYKEHKKPIGSLHGLPISLKDQFHVRNVETTMGYTGWVGTFEGDKNTGKERVFESVMVKELRNMGAVLYCKTSVPQTLMCGETINNIAGYCHNPKNRNLSSGGSSGGEGALLSLRGSPLGFGTDIGGSIRIPAGFNGLFGLRPSTGRLPYEGVANSYQGQNSILSVVGPLSHSVKGLKIAMKAVLSQQPWLEDPLVPEIPWREDHYQSAVDAAKEKGKLTFAVIRSDGLCQCYPPVRRAVETTVKALEERGHKVIEWNPPSHATAVAIAVKVWGYDSGAAVARDFELSGEPVLEHIAGGPTGGPVASATEIFATNVRQRQYQKEYMDYWNSTAALTGTGKPVDAIICPIASFPAPRPKRFFHLGYTMVWNVVDYAVSTFPVTTADKAIDIVDPNFKPLNDVDQKTQADYDPELYHGAHVGLQLVGRKYQEEKILALTDYVAQCLHGGKPGAKL